MDTLAHSCRSQGKKGIFYSYSLTSEDVERLDKVGEELERMLGQFESPAGVAFKRQLGPR